MSENFEQNSTPQELTPEQEAAKVEEYHSLEGSAGQEARDLIDERIDKSLEGQERWIAMVGLMRNLMEEDSQRYRLTYERIAQIISFEKVAAQQAELEAKYGAEVGPSKTVH